MAKRAECSPGVVLVLSFVATWLFVRNLETITYIFWLGLGFVAGAILGFFGTVLLRRGLNRKWVLELVFALGSLGMCSWLVSLPWKGIDQSLIDLANEADSVSEFYQSLTPWGVRLVNSQMAGMWLLAANALVILLRGLHVLSLAMVDPRKPYGLSTRIALATRHASGLRGIALILFAGWLAWYMLIAAQNPHAFIWRILGSGGM